MKKIIFVILLSISSLYAQSFSKHDILGVWEVSALKSLSGFTAFGKDFSTTRGKAYTLVFSKSNRVKNKTTGTIYNYEIINGNLKIYQTKTYRNNYQVKEKNKYDLFFMSGNYEGCKVVKIKKKKITGYYRKEGYKWCKVQNYPRSTFYTNEDFKF